MTSFSYYGRVNPTWPLCAGCEEPTPAESLNDDALCIDCVDREKQRLVKVEQEEAARSFRKQSKWWFHGVMRAPLHVLMDQRDAEAAAARQALPENSERDDARDVA